MKKLYSFIAILAVTSATLFAGPFGLSMGMNFQEVTNACGGERPRRIQGDDRYFIQPVKKHSRFKTYIAWISDEYGLYAVRGISDNIPMDKYGKELQNAFYSFKERVSAIYGSGTLFDDLVNTNISKFMQGDDYWSQTLKEGDRELFAEWRSSEKSKMKDDLVLIRLWTAADGYVSFKGILLIDYQFNNISAVENKEDDVL